MDGDLELALSLADDADAISMRHYRTDDLAIETKADLTPVTVADKGVEEALRTRLGRERPDEAIAGEEYGVAEGDVRWWLDPIDGTKQYARGLPIWATLIALERGGEAVVAVASAPALGQRWWATRGGGAFANGERIHVSSVSQLDEAYVSTSSLRSFPAFVQVGPHVALARTYPDFWQYMLVAEGRIEAGCDPQLAPWDVVAPKLIVEEAGGRFTEEPGLWLASNGVLHDQLRALLLPA
jgi:histidinol-phosphatase